VARNEDLGRKARKGRVGDSPRLGRENINSPPITYAQDKKGCPSCGQEFGLMVKSTPEILEALRRMGGAGSEGSEGVGGTE
jgi:hypothetical protein